MSGGAGRRKHGISGWIVLDEVLADAGDEAAIAARGMPNTSSSSADAVASQLRELGCDITRNSRAQWVADPADPAVYAWQRSVKSRSARTRIL